MVEQYAPFDELWTISDFALKWIPSLKPSKNYFVLHIYACLNRFQAYEYGRQLLNTSQLEKTASSTETMQNHKLKSKRGTKQRKWCKWKKKCCKRQAHASSSNVLQIEKRSANQETIFKRKTICKRKTIVLQTCRGRSQRNSSKERHTRW